MAGLAKTKGDRPRGAPWIEQCFLLFAETSVPPSTSPRLSSHFSNALGWCHGRGQYIARRLFIFIFRQSNELIPSNPHFSWCASCPSPLFDFHVQDPLYPFVCADCKAGFNAVKALDFHQKEVHKVRGCGEESEA